MAWEKKYRNRNRFQAEQELKLFFGGLPLNAPTLRIEAWFLAASRVKESWVIGVYILLPKWEEQTKRGVLNLAKLGQRD